MQGYVVFVWEIPFSSYPDNKVHGVNMGPIWGRQDPGGPHVGPMNFDIRVGWLKNPGGPLIDRLIYMNDEKLFSQHSPVPHKYCMYKSPV